MVLRRESITERLKELDLIVQELNQYQSLSVEELSNDLSQRTNYIKNSRGSVDFATSWYIAIKRLTYSNCGLISKKQAASSHNLPLKFSRGWMSKCRLTVSNHHK
jgi:hypothetical protein